jgi:hypothetical protein
MNIFTLSFQCTSIIEWMHFNGDHKDNVDVAQRPRYHIIVELGMAHSE